MQWPITARRPAISLPSLNKRQWIRIGAVAAALALVATGGIITRSFYASDGRSAAQQVTAYSATDPLTVSRVFRPLTACAA